MALSGIPGWQKRAGDQDTGDGGEMPCVRHRYRHLGYNNDLNRQFLHTSSLHSGWRRQIINKYMHIFILGSV